MGGNVALTLPIMFSGDCCEPTEQAVLTFIELTPNVSGPVSSAVAPVFVVGRGDATNAQWTVHREPRVQTENTAAACSTLH